MRAWSGATRYSRSGVAAFGAGCVLVGALLVGFVDAVLEDVLGIVGGPSVGEKRFDVDVLVDDGGEDDVEVGTGFDAMTFGAGEDGGSHGFPVLAGK